MCYSFFKEPTYSMDAVQYADNNKEPIGVAELLSISSFNSNATAFQGPVLVCIL
jgi:hypothetical protein